MDDSTQWWVIAGVLVAVELATGTFYLLMLAVGAMAGALAAHADRPVAQQLAIAAIVGSLCAGSWYAKRRRQHKLRPTKSLGIQDDPDLSLDLGQTVMVTAWQADGTTQVIYRGAPWSARLRHPLNEQAQPEPGAYRICAMQGNNLLLEKA